MTRSANYIAAGFFWNTVSSILNALQGVVFLAFVTRVSGPYLGGVFSFAYMIGQQYRPLGAFEMRVYQATDMSSTFTFGTYCISRVITAALMILAIIVTAFCSEGVTYEAVAVISIALLRVLDVVEDVFHGKLQQLGRLDLAARALSVRIAITSIGFCVLFFFTKDLLLSSLATLVLSAAAVYFLNVPLSVREFDTSISISDFSRLSHLFGACLPLFLAAFLSGYLPNASKFAVEAAMSKEALAQYSVLFMPAMVINLACGFVFQPLLSHLAGSLSDAGNRAFVQLIIRGIALSGIVGFAVAVVTGFIGIPLLEIVYDVSLEGLNPALQMLMVAGIFNACNTVLYYGLVTLRAQRLILVSYAFVSLLALLISRMLTIQLGLLGASLSYTLAMLALFVVSSAALGLTIRMRGKTNRAS